MTFLFLLLGCPETISELDNTDHFPDDADADGWTVEEGDCNDEDRSISPGQAEIWYDGIDQDCAGGDDQDQDGDGTAVDKDCDDTDATVRPRADELCDGKDNDCDEDIDENPTDGTSAYRDADLDGYADDDATAVSVCTVTPGYTTLLGDCNDRDRDVAPGARETCNGDDDDCDGSVDEDVADADVWYQDADADGYGDAARWVRACEAPVGFVDDDTDCDDGEGAAHPGAAELCDELDNDCDGNVDDNVTDATTVWPDLDGDGYGDDTATPATACAYTGAVQAGDCDDADGTVYPGAVEACDLLDNDCDGAVDDDVAYVDYYVDADSDGFGAGAAAGNDCLVPAGHVANDDDCDDTDGAVSPAAVEVCDGTDNDCSGAVDDDASDAVSWYLDEDADTFGTDDAITACDASGDHTAEVGGDCDDDDADVYPGAAEEDDGLDQDCDDFADEDFVSDGDIVITEIARQTWMGGSSTDTDGQWFEVLNVSSRDVNLSNWLVQRTSAVGTDSFRVDPADEITVFAGEYLVFCASSLYDAAVDNDSLLECDYVWGDPAYPDTYEGTYKDNTFHIQRDADALSIQADGSGRDEVAWDATWPATATQSLALDSAALNATDNDLAASWALDSVNPWWDDGASSPEYGTPGY